MNILPHSLHGYVLCLLFVGDVLDGLEFVDFLEAVWGRCDGGGSGGGGNDDGAADNGGGVGSCATADTASGDLGTAIAELGG